MTGRELIFLIMVELLFFSKVICRIIETLYALANSGVALVTWLSAEINDPNEYTTSVLWLVVSNHSIG